MARPAHCRFLSLVLASSFALMGVPGLAPGQARDVEQLQLYGRVQWATASKMVITTDCGFLERGCTPTSVAIDLTRVPLSEYRGIRSGNWVRVDGVVAHRNGQHWVLAKSVVIVQEPEAP